MLKFNGIWVIAIWINMKIEDIIDAIKLYFLKRKIRRQRKNK